MSRVRKLAVVVIMSCGALAAVASPSAADQPPPVRNATLITGPPVAFHPGVVTADLQHGLVLGSTTYVHSDGFVYTQVRVPYLWSDNGSSPTSVLMEPPGDLATFPSIYIPNAVTPNGSTVVGGVIFPEELSTAPWAWTPTTGLQFLQLPADTRYGGGAVGVSTNGNVIAGTLAGRFVASKAAVWQDGTLETLPTSQAWSVANAISGDGSVVIGAAGPSSAALQATSWVHGSEQPLSTGDLHPLASTALFTANGTIFGTAILSSGQTVLLRWGADGRLTVLMPPDGLSVVQFSSVDSVGSAVGGALAPKTQCISFLDPACDQQPFIWTAQDGFTILPETPVLIQNRNAFGDKSTVTGVADGGRVAVGNLTPAESINGFPPQDSFVWSAQSGLVTVDDLMSSFGQPNPDYYAAGNVSPDGTEALVSGNAPNDAAPYDTGTLLLNLTPLWTGQTRVTGIGPTTTQTSQKTQSQGDALKQQLMGLPTDLLGQLQSWPGAVSLLGRSTGSPGDATASTGG